MKIALAQMNYTIGDFEANKMKIIGCVNQAKAQGVDLLVFSEQAVSGAPAYDLLNKVSFLDLCEDSLVEIASYCDNISVLVGMPAQSTNNKTISVAALIEDRNGMSLKKRSIRATNSFISPRRKVASISKYAARKSPWS